MSAFVVGHDHIDALLTFAIDKRVSYWLESTRSRIDITRANAEEIGRILLHENERSVGERYETHDPDEMPGTVGETDGNYKYRMFHPAASALVILKGCACFEYQSCEHDGWSASVAASIIEEIRRAAIRALPGYDGADGWEIRRKQRAA